MVLRTLMMVTAAALCSGCARIGFNAERADAAVDSPGATFDSGGAGDQAAPPAEGGGTLDAKGPTPDSFKPTACQPPCSGGVCCVRKGQTKPSCGAGYYLCQCDPQSKTPCADNEPVCCDRGQGYLCYPTHYKCRCDSKSGAPCGGKEPFCCTKGASSTCEPTPYKCTCDPKTNLPCGGSEPICCTLSAPPVCEPTFACTS